MLQYLSVYLLKLATDWLERAFVPSPFVWNQKAYYNHVESVCRAIGEYQGKHYQLLDILSGADKVRHSGERKWWGYKDNKLALCRFDDLSDGIRWIMLNEPPVNMPER
jgi:hypothetical protein